MITAIRVVHQAPTADGCAAKLWLLAAPVVAVLPFAAQVSCALRCVSMLGMETAMQSAIG